MERDARAAGLTEMRLKQDRGAVDQVLFQGYALGVAFDDDLGGGRELELVGEVDGLQHRGDVVVAVVSPAQDFERKIDLGEGREAERRLRRHGRGSLGWRGGARPIRQWSASRRGAWGRRPRC